MRILLLLRKELTHLTTSLPLKTQRIEWTQLTDNKQEWGSTDKNENVTILDVEYLSFITTSVNDREMKSDLMKIISYHSK